MTAVMPETMAQLVRERGLPVTEKDLVTALDEALLARATSPGAASLTVAAQTFLDDHGGLPHLTESGPDVVGAAVADTAGQFLALAATSLTGDQVAARLGIDASTVRGRISRGELHTLRVGRRNRLPAWQFTPTGALPYLGTLLPTVPADLHPLEVEAFFTVPSPDLTIGDSNQRLSPAQWLTAGGDPARVADLITGLTLTP